MELTQNTRKVWGGTHRGVKIEIINWDLGGKDSWNYYLWLFLSKIPTENNPESYWLEGKKTKYGSYIDYNYYGHKILSGLNFHGGITWYSKERGFDGDEKVIKVGCAYNHLYDEGRIYNLDIVKHDAMATVDDFLSYVPDYKYYCCGNGKLYLLKDGIDNDGTFYSREYWSDKQIFKTLSEKEGT